MIPVDLTDKLALVTGGSGKLGRAMVRTLGRAGADVVVHYHRNERQAQELAAELQAMGRRGLVLQADITDQRSVLDMRQGVETNLRSPDIIVANAVIQYEWKSLLEQSPANYESQFRSCVMHSVLLAQAFVPAMINRGWGRVIGISTECAMRCWNGESAYAAGKRGMDGVFRVLAREVGEHGITVNQVAPGWTISDDAPESDATAAYCREVPLKRRGTDQEIANVVAFLASDLAGFITGAYIPVCGGRVMPAI